jgi:large subunit ribosomal protein L9
MKLILLSDVKALGAKGTVVEVADGYARNFLIPKKHGVEATKGALAQYEEQRKAKIRREADEQAGAQELAEKLSSQNVKVGAKAGGNGRLFGTITNQDVADAILKLFNVEVDKHRIEVKEGIKALGTYPFTVRLGKNITATSSVQVVAEN